MTFTLQAAADDATGRDHRSLEIGTIRSGQVLRFELDYMPGEEGLAVPRRISPWVFRLGDANADASLDVSDAISVLRHLFAAGSAPPCAGAADANGDGEVDIVDPVAVLLHLFRGVDPSRGNLGRCVEAAPDGSLGCLSYPVPCSP